MSIDEFGVTFDPAIKKEIVGMKAEDWTRIVIDRMSLTEKIAPVSRLALKFPVCLSYLPSHIHISFMLQAELARRWHVHLESMYSKSTSLACLLRLGFILDLAPDDTLCVCSLSSPVEVLPGVLETVEAFERLGIPQAIATSSTREAVAKKRVPHEALFSKFGKIVTGSDVTKGKPDPEIFLLAASELGVDPTKCVVFEDSPVR